MSWDKPSAFDCDALPDIVADFDRMLRLFIACHDASHAIAGVLMREAIGKSGHILAINAGGRAEPGHSAHAQPGWRVTAVDPSVAMWERGRARLAATGAGERRHRNGGLRNHGCQK